MQIALDWLADYVDVSDISAEELADILTMGGVEAVAMGRTLANDSVVIGHVLEAEKHPNADRLTVCTVNVGEESPSTIVCGAPNVAAGQKVAVALPGAVLPDGMKIKKAKIRKVESSGMICAEDELGLGDDHTGIIVLPEDAPVGERFLSYLCVDGHQIKLDVTPNRPDALSHIGMARDIAALLKKPFIMPEISVEENGPDVNTLAAVEIDDPAGCPRYVARVIENVKIGPSPAWLAGRLQQAGVRPINNVVDVTNYVLMGIGHPLHAFDLDQVAGRKIIVRAAADGGEKFVTLDGQEREIPEGSVFICDGEKPVALGGIMGGENSEIGHQTTNVLLEAAYFNPSRIRKTAKQVGLQTEASYRFERGADYTCVTAAVDWAAMLISQLAGGTVAKGRIDAYPVELKQPEITFRLNQIPRVLGIDVSRDETRRYFEDLGATITEETDGAFTVVPPPWRPDLEREIDMIEEVARLYGYDNIPTVVKSANTAPEEPQPVETLMENMRDWLIGSGLTEVITSSLVSKEYADCIPVDGDPVELANYSNIEMSYMRTHMLPSLLGVAERNFSHRLTQGISVFEIGNVFTRKSEGKYQQKRFVGMLMTGAASAGYWADADRDFDFYDLKGCAETVLSRCSESRVEFVHYDSAEFAPGVGARILLADEEVGFLGLVQKELASQYDLTRPVFYCQLDIARLVTHRRTGSRMEPLPKYPAIELDLAFVVSESVEAAMVNEIIEKSGGSLLKSYSLFDVYHGDGLETNEKSLGFRLTFRADDRTLTDNDVDGYVKRIITTAGEQVGARIRT